MRKLFVMLAAMVATVAAGFLLSPAANADQGDGTLACAVGEICLKEHVNSISYPDGSYIRHFWYADASHNDDYFTNSGNVLMDKLTATWSRDTECNVQLQDVSNNYWWTYYEVTPRVDGNNNYQYLGDAANDRNNRHLRCGSL